MSDKKMGASERLNFFLAPLAILGGLATVVSCILAFLTFISPHTVSSIIYAIYPQPTSQPQLIYVTSLPPLITPSLTIVSPTSTVSPIPLPTNTKIPTATPIPDTLPGTILEVGQSWRQEGYEANLDKNRLIISNSGIGVEFLVSLISHKSQNIAISYSFGSFEGIDNLSQSIKFKAISEDGTIHYGCDDTKIISPGEKIYLCNLWILAITDISNPSLTEIIITVNVADIHDARWRIPVPH